jgi:hypothetical protein
MIFTTTKKKVEKEEIFPGTPVMTLHKLSEEKGSKTVFEFNATAMEALGFPLNTPSTSRIAHGYDESNRLVLATLDTNDAYTSNITAKNTFSSQKLFERLAKEFNVDGFSTQHFELRFIDSDDSGSLYYGLNKINSGAFPEETLEDSQMDDLDASSMLFQDDLAAIGKADNQDEQEAPLNVSTTTNTNNINGFVGDEKPEIASIW